MKTGKSVKPTRWAIVANPTAGQPEGSIKTGPPNPTAFFSPPSLQTVMLAGKSQKISSALSG